MSLLEDQLSDYLRIRRALGYKLARTEKLLLQFIAFLEERDERVITIENTLAWVTLPGGSDSWRALRLSAVRGFAAYLHALDDAHEVPPVDLCPNRPARATPYLYSAQEIAALMAATVVLRGRLRRATYRTLIGLLAVTGMRVGEAIRLDRDDVDLAHGVLTVRDTKFGKSRELPVHPSTVESAAQLRPRARPALPGTDHRGGAGLPSGNPAALLRRARHVQAAPRPRRPQAALGDLSPPDSRLKAPVRCADAARLVSVRGRCAAADAVAVHVSRARPAQRQLLVSDRRARAARARR